MHYLRRKKSVGKGRCLCFEGTNSGVWSGNSSNGLYMERCFLLGESVYRK